MKFPFNEPENTAAITCSHIVECCDTILYVSHDGDDGMWQFLCGEMHKHEDARIVALSEVFSMDNSIYELADMPCGYVAERENKNSVWIIKEKTID